MIMRHCLGLEGARGGRLLLLLHQPHVRHQVPPPSSCWTIFIHNNHFQSRDFFIKSLDDSASGIQAIMARLADRLVPVGQNRMQISSSPNPTRLREVDQVSADILNEQVCWLNTISSCHQTEVSLRCWANFLRLLTEVSLRCWANFLRHLTNKALNRYPKFDIIRWKWLSIIIR